MKIILVDKNVRLLRDDDELIAENVSVWNATKITKLLVAASDDYSHVYVQRPNDYELFKHVPRTI